MRRDATSSRQIIIDNQGRCRTGIDEIRQRDAPLKKAVSGRGTMNLILPEKRLLGTD